MGARFIEQEHDLRSDQIICMAPRSGGDQDCYLRILRKITTLE